MTTLVKVPTADPTYPSRDGRPVAYAVLGVQEYWLFDPRGEWIAEKLRGFRLETAEEEGETSNFYTPITDSTSAVLQLRLQVEGALIGFYRLDNSQKLLVPAELAAELRATASLLEKERQARQQAELAREEAELARAEAERAREEAEQRAKQERLRQQALAERLRALGVDPESI